MEKQDFPRFPPLMRVLHWLLAVLLLGMLFIGAAMVTSLSAYHRLLGLHRPLGAAILVLAVIRLLNRRYSELPPFPVTMSERERRIASLSEWLLYGLMIGIPIVGWGMLSAGHYPIVLCGSLRLPPILPASPPLYAVLRRTHTVLAYTLFFAFIAHLSGVLFHTLILRDGLLRRMASWRK